MIAAVNGAAHDAGGISADGLALPRGIHASFSADPRSTRTLTWFTDTGSDPGSMVEYGPVTPDMDVEAVQGAPFPARTDGTVDPVHGVDALTHRVTASGLDPALP
ncbi:fibronectin type III domain-containing protein, partial [Algiphilus sp.]|uniref:fibronectin type III domain-containing protein n=1 Tax=Algiphilus sp. TaxID=1872431 RepID=UPI003C5B17A9